MSTSPTNKIFEQNLHNCRKRLYEQAMRLTHGKSADAEDLVQETLMRAVQWQESFRQSESLGPWLRTILFNTFVNDYRRKRRRPQVLLSDLPEGPRRRIEENLPDPAYSAGSSERNLIAREQSDAALAALDRLSTPLREALYLSLVEQLSYTQISERLAIPLGTVRSRLFRGRERLERAVYSYRMP
jgi:RNA polymerase sigma-70 factor (ECF subfamily)